MQMLKEEHYFPPFPEIRFGGLLIQKLISCEILLSHIPINPISYFCKQHLTQFAYENIPRFLPPFPFRNYLSINVNAFSLGFN